MKPAKSPKKPKQSRGGERGELPAAGTDIFESTIDKSHYTPQGEHPEDRIYRDREYIHRLRAHLDEVYDALERDLGIIDDCNWLFDFIHNEVREGEFEDYLADYGVQYKDIAVGKGGKGAGRNKAGARGTRG